MVRGMGQGRKRGGRGSGWEKVVCFNNRVRYPIFAINGKEKEMKWTETKNRSCSRCDNH